MIEAVWYGTAAALSFIGFMSLFCLILLYIYRPKKKNEYIIIIDDKTEKNEISHLIYSAYLRNLIFGTLFCDSVTVVDCGADEEIRQLVAEEAARYGSITVCTPGEIISSITGKEKDGSGAC